MIHLLILLFPLFYYGRAQTLNPSAFPLTVRSPYLSCWMINAGNIANNSAGAYGGQVRGLNVWPFCPWHTNTVNEIQNLNIPFLVRVDNITYSLLGDPSPINVFSNLTNTVISPTQTQFTAEAGGMQFQLTFLNPIEVRAQAEIDFII
jgi:hypothetical protein